MRRIDWSTDEMRKRIRIVESGCWEWLLCKNADGYGQLFLRGRGERAHRLSWILFRGSIPPGMHVLHRCDNPPCVNPEHLFLVRPADNHADKVKKGRAVYVRGSAVTLSVFTEESVAAMRLDRAAGMHIDDVTKKYGISRAAVYKAANRDTWKHVP